MTYDIGGTPISFVDIRIGDVIARQRDDSWIVGTVSEVETSSMGTYDGWILARTGDTDLRLIERPKPPLPTEPGSRINNVVSQGGAEFVFAIRTFASDYRTEYEWMGFNGDGGTSFFDTSHIASWEPA